MGEGRTLVVVFLRGGLDGLNTVVPVFEDAYHERRPSLALAARRPGETTGGAVPLGGGDLPFALHEGMEPLLPAYRDGRLAVVHAVGSDDGTRSHFEAQDQMEHGAAFAAPLAGGWAARWLRTLDRAGALSALAFGTAVPESLRGAPSVTAVEALSDVRLSVDAGRAAAVSDALASLYGVLREDREPNSVLLHHAARDALALIERIGEIGGEAAAGEGYPRTDLGRSLAQVAALVRSDVGLRVAAVDHGGFDTHFGQALLLEDLLRELADALSAFDRDIGASSELRERVTVVCVTEFGRRTYENSALGTDHGRGSCAFVLGGGVAGGRVVTRWPGLGEDALEGPGDLAVTTDYRDLLWEILARRFGAADVGSVFPGLVHRPVDVMA